MAIRSLARSSIRQAGRVNSALAGYESNYFHHLETVRLGGNAASVTFSNLSRYSDYQHFQIRFVSRITENVGGAGTFYTNLNGDTGTTYARHLLRADGSSVTSNGLFNTGTPDIGFAPGAETTSTIFGAGVIDLLDAFDTNKFKTMRSSSGMYGGTYKEVWLSSLLWRNTDAVTSWSFETYGAFNFVAGCRFSLYGLKARA